MTIQVHDHKYFTAADGQPRLQLEILVPNAEISASVLAHVVGIVGQHRSEFAKAALQVIPAEEVPEKAEAVSEVVPKTAPNATPVEVTAPVAHSKDVGAPKKSDKKSKKSKKTESAAAAISEEPKVEPTKDANTAEAANGVIPPPPEVVSATAFRSVLTWMVDNGYNDVDTIVPLCEAWRDQVPALGRMAGNIRNRVERALTALGSGA